MLHVSLPGKISSCSSELIDRGALNRTGIHVATWMMQYLSRVAELTFLRVILNFCNINRLNRHFVMKTLLVLIEYLSESH